MSIAYLSRSLFPTPTQSKRSSTHLASKSSIHPVIRLFLSAQQQVESVRCLPNFLLVAGRGSANSTQSSVKDSHSVRCYWRSRFVWIARQSEQQALATVAKRCVAVSASVDSDCGCNASEATNSCCDVVCRRRCQVFYLFCCQLCCCDITFSYHVRRPPFCTCV